MTAGEWNPMAQAFEPAAPTLVEFLLARIAEDELAGLRAQHNAGMFGAPDHVVRWSPARVLAECQAKRQIVERISDVKGWSGSYAVRDVVLELLALPYAGHPDYREEWRS